MTTSEKLIQAADKLAHNNVESDSGITEIYLFPSLEQIRLIEVDENVPPSEQIEPFYFGADPGSGLEFSSAIALIRPEERHTLRPPVGWGEWDEAERIWPKVKGNGR